MIIRQCTRAPSVRQQVVNISHRQLYSNSTHNLERTNSQKEWVLTRVGCNQARSLRARLNHAQLLNPCCALQRRTMSSLTTGPAEQYELADLQPPTPLRPAPQTPESINWVLDKTNMLKTAEMVEINAWIRRIFTTFGVPVCVVVVPTLPSGYLSPKYCATDLFNSWGIGDEALHNGVLVFLAMKERRIEVEVGSGMERVLSFFFLNTMEYREMVPRMAKGNTGAAIIRGLELIYWEIKANSNMIGVLPSDYVKPLSPQERNQHDQNSSQNNYDSRSFERTQMEDGGAPPRPRRTSLPGASFLKWLVFGSMAAVAAWIFYLIEEAHRCPQCHEKTLYEDVLDQPTLAEFPGTLTSLDLDNIAAGRVRLARDRCSSCHFTRVYKRYTGANNDTRVVVIHNGSDDNNKNISHSYSSSSSSSSSPISWSSSSSGSSGGGRSSGGGSGASW